MVFDLTCHATALFLSTGQIINLLVFPSIFIEWRFSYSPTMNPNRSKKPKSQVEVIPTNQSTPPSCAVCRKAESNAQLKKADVKRFQLLETLEPEEPAKGPSCCPLIDCFTSIFDGSSTSTKKNKRKSKKKKSKVDRSAQYMYKEEYSQNCYVAHLQYRYRWWQPFPR